MVAICLTCGTAAVSSAAAATQHWGSATPAAEIEPGTEQSFTGELTVPSVTLEWSFGGGNTSIVCNKLSTSGTAYNNETAGQLSSASLALSGCVITTPHCAVKEGSIPFQALTGYARTESGQRRLVLKPQVGSVMALIYLEGAGGGSCAYGSSLTMSGYIEAIQVAGHPGTYEVPLSPSHLALGAIPVKMLTEFSLNASSGQSLQLSGEGPEGAYWYYGQGPWSLINAGESTSYVNVEPVPLTLNTQVGLTKPEIRCDGSFNGKVENPVGGGAGVATAGYTPGSLGGCTINISHCYVEGAPTNLLSGVATEVGGAPAVEWSPQSGTTVMSFQLGSVGGTCSLINLSPLKVTGRLITSSLGNGRFSFAASELRVGSQAAPVSGEFGLETLFGKSLRLQP